MQQRDSRVSTQITSRMCTVNDSLASYDSAIIQPAVVELIIPGWKDSHQTSFLQGKK